MLSLIVYLVVCRFGDRQDVHFPAWETLSSKYNALHPRVFHWSIEYIHSETESHVPAGTFASLVHRIKPQHDIVYVRTGSSAHQSDIVLFAREAAHLLPRTVSLLTTDGDLAVPSSLSLDVVSAICSSVFAWYTQNWDGTHGDCIRPFPIGLDIHTKAWDILPKIRHARAFAKPLASRVGRVLFAGTIDSMSRQRLLSAAVTKSWDALSHMPPEKYLATVASHKFVASPEGNGIDCHRTWEAIYLGCIVIVIQGSSISPVYRGLAVLQVPSWSSITQDVLDAAEKKYAARTVSRLNMLQRDDWIARIPVNQPPL